MPTNTIRILTIVLVQLCFVKVFAQLQIFDQQKVNKIFITIPVDSLDSVIKHINNNYYHASFKYTNGTDTLAVDTIGFRIRGNTSLISKKKSFKIAFDAFDSTAKYLGLRKINLIGNHNDPTMVREKLFYECWQKAGFPARNTSFVNLYINEQYYGLYTNNEEIDKLWLKRSFGNNSGNLYKCSYGADLNFISNNATDYKFMGGNNTRTYDLQTNEITDDYTDLTNLISQINKPYSATYVSNLENYFHVNDYLKALALDVATGNWDSYAWNKNNYFLYHDSVTNKFRFITFDTDNTFGVDWSGINWTTRSATKWYHDTQARPLASKLMQDVNAKNIFLQHLQNITHLITKPDSIFGRIDAMQNLIIQYVALDSFRTLDYNYDLNSFIQGFIATVDNHTPFGIKPFLSKRFANFVPLFINNILVDSNIFIFPNPITTNFTITITPELLNSNATIYDMAGRPLYNFILNNFENKIDNFELKSGTYFLQIRQANFKTMQLQIIKK